MKTETYKENAARNGQFVFEQFQEEKWAEMRLHRFSPVSTYEPDPKELIQVCPGCGGGPHHFDLDCFAGYLCNDCGTYVDFEQRWIVFRRFKEVLRGTN
jgi:hypothetical protein